MLGLIEDINKLMTSYFKNEDDDIYILGINKGEIGGSEYLSYIHNKVKGDAPDIELENEIKLHKTILELINSGYINSAHDISEGGIAVALAECCVMNKTKNIGCEINYKYEFRKDFDMFSETQSRVIISANKKNEKDIAKICNKYNIKFIKIGSTGGAHLRINGDVNINLEKINDAYFRKLDKIMVSN
jgi:phosphoribosylformylglycinamidine synthase